MNEGTTCIQTVLDNVYEALGEAHRAWMAGYRCEWVSAIDPPSADKCRHTVVCIGETARGSQYWLCAMHRSAWLAEFSDGKLVDPDSQFKSFQEMIRDPETGVVDSACCRARQRVEERVVELTNENNVLRMKLGALP